MGRASEIERNTSETKIKIKFDLDGKGGSKVNTRIGFFDHMLTLLAKHGLFELELDAKGDTYVDSHHTVEDVGIVLGQAIKEALGDKKGIARYGNASVPMDECLTRVDLDISGRPFLVFNAEFSNDNIGEMQSEMVQEFFRAVAFNSGMTLHINLVYGSNDHHIAESIFKAFARALDMAVQIDPRINGVLSTKGVL